jgi:quinoprotein glucose dehydrogenase
MQGKFAGLVTRLLQPEPTVRHVAACADAGEASAPLVSRYPGVAAGGDSSRVPAGFGPWVRLGQVPSGAAGLVLALGLLAAPAYASAQHGASNGEWPGYGGDLGSTKYSPLSQVDANNVSRLAVAWNWSSPDNALAAEVATLNPSTFKGTPIMVDGVLYIRTSLSLVAAVDAATGDELWTFDPRSYEGGRLPNLGFNTRGVAHWSAGPESTVFVATGDAHLWAVDARTGKPNEAFGDGGKIDLTLGLRRPVPRQDYTVMSPPLVVGDLVVVGSAINDVPQRMTAPPGDVRAFDVRTGEQRWTFHTIPQPGEFGHETWEDGSWEYTGNTNVWTMMSADEELGIVYLPVSTPTNDWYGGHRLGDNLFAESLVALDATTGERLWHFQFVRHGVWDYDLPAAPILVDVTVNGSPVKAVAQITKQGFVYVFDRVTGEPVWPIVERPVPPSTVPGERLSPTQPVPSRPAPFDRQGIVVDELIDFTPELRAEAERIIANYDYGGLFHPPSERGTINLPGWMGGANWFGASVDPATGILYVPSRTSPIVVQLVQPDPERSDFRYVRGGAGAVAGPEGLPLFQPPHARITAIDLNTGDHLWRVPLGDGARQRVMDLGIPDPGPLGGGSFTGPVLTETLLFIGHIGARDGNPDPTAAALLAFDKATGELVHAIDLPAAPTGTPMTYQVDGRQFVAVAYGGGRDAGMIGLALE